MSVILNLLSLIDFQTAYECLFYAPNGYKIVICHLNCSIAFEVRLGPSQGRVPFDVEKLYEEMIRRGELTSGVIYGWFHWNVIHPMSKGHSYSYIDFDELSHRPSRVYFTGGPIIGTPRGDLSPEYYCSKGTIKSMATLPVTPLRFSVDEVNDIRNIARELMECQENDEE